MGARRGGYGPADADCGCLGVAALLAMAALAAAFLAFILADTPINDADADAGDGVAVGAPVLQLDTSNAALMHSYGLPTKDDVMHFHLGGVWGYYEVWDGSDALRAYDELPGSESMWDEVYGIDASNPAFSY